jgi:predicted house-cleaning noncanonical NTP pyrophosphatase (MazG superfamily)
MINNAALKATERELLKLIRFFRKRGEQLAEAGELTEESEKLSEACQNLEAQLYRHAENRTAILDKRDRLNKIIEDNAQCPKCHKADMLKKTGVATNEYGWKSNTYRCRRCNTSFTWNRPNNPWDMVAFLERYIQELEQSLQQEHREDMRHHIEGAIPQLQDSLFRLRPVLQTSDEEVEALEQKEKEMGKLIHQFKNYLLIEKIKLDTYPNEED